MFGVALTGALFESLQTRDTVNAAADRGIHITDASARTLDGLMSGTSDASTALAHYPAAHHAQLKAAVHEGFVTAFGTAMELSFGLVVLGIVLTFVLIRRQPEVDQLPGPERHPALLRDRAQALAQVSSGPRPEAGCSPAARRAAARSPAARRAGDRSAGDRTPALRAERARRWTRCRAAAGRRSAAR